MDLSVVAASAERGEHDIENEMVFTSNPGFRFHDSRGFESGDIIELDKVKAFIMQRSREQKMENRLHAIWYCIPVDDSRPFTAAEKQFFSTFGTGNSPVIALFTKFDALDTKAFSVLRQENLSRADARSGAPKRAISDFNQQHLSTFYDQLYPPKRHVYLRDMNKEGADCNELIRQTAGALDSEFLESLLVSTQENSLELCTEFAFRRTVLPVLVKVMGEKPRLSPLKETLTAKEVQKLVIGIFTWFPRLVVKSTHKIQQVILLGMAVTLSAQHSFFLRDRGISSAFTVALQRYAVSPQRQSVTLAVQDISAELSPLPLETEWEEKTLRALMQVVQDNRLGTQ
ncbi:hypothetical protein M408DRAFT_330670 [Serendipita vermifera MAFF 305830]|uniref:G domain-containing protein n=1 Tax=Serendipita vermifera MAFF 305830 TaxID=933852 RepID=A0A0C2XAT5_SERVB|nr:hypothetical protein M408DRAFT_330670 [Serendipita vermifera MAFF 305830]